MKKEKIRKRFVVGLPMRTCNQSGQAEREIGAYWDRFYRDGIPSKIFGKVSDEIIVIYTDYEGDYTMPYTYIGGFEVADLKHLPEGFVGVEVPAGEYASYLAHGPFPDALQKVWHQIWNSPLPRAYTIDMEIYPADFTPEKGQDIKVYIALKSRTCSRGYGTS